MKRNYVYFLFTCLLTFVVSGCDTDIEPEVIQADVYKRQVLRTSTDNGASWSTPKLIAPEHTKRHQVIAGTIRTREGWLVQACLLYTSTALAYIKMCVKNSCLNFLKHQEYAWSYAENIQKKAPVYETEPDSVYTPVSYTHLDVYKRQKPSRSLRNTHLARCKA